MHANLRYPPPILLTSCIYVADQEVSLKAPQQRISHTLESVGKWLALYPELTLRLVICDSSAFDFMPLVKAQFPDAQIECLNFQADTSKVSYHGKGYGEGEIVRFALENSRFLAEAEYFAKCTAKLWVENFRQCLQEWNGSLLLNATFTNVFSLRKTRFKHVDTRFYLISREIYQRHFMNAHREIGGASGRSIEDAFKDVVLEAGLAGAIFRQPPVIGGVGGGTGKYYNTSFSKRLKERLRFRLARLSPAYRTLFNRASS